MVTFISFVLFDDCALPSLDVRSPTPTHTCNDANYVNLWIPATRSERHLFQDRLNLQYCLLRPQHPKLLLWARRRSHPKFASSCTCVLPRVHLPIAPLAKTLIAFFVLCGLERVWATLTRPRPTALLGRMYVVRSCWLIAGR